MKEPIPAALNHPQPLPRSPPSCGRRGGGAAGGRAAGGTTASAPGGARSSPGSGSPWSLPARPPVPGALGAAAAAPAARAAVMAGPGLAVGPRWERLALSSAPSAGTRRRAEPPFQPWGLRAL